ncbi:hypothetical protein M9458_012538, partial [Cirrhinus mrigala]
MALGSGKHPLAAASVRHAESSHSGVLCGGAGGTSGAGALLRRMGPDATDRGPREDPAGSLLQDHR